MYRPPENTNRVKSIKSKFENPAHTAQPFVKPPLIKSKTLQDFHFDRQSDPIKRNIKRTPAFRIDKNSPDTHDTKLQLRSRVVETKSRLSCEQAETINSFSSIRDKFDGVQRKVGADYLKYLYAEPIPKAQRAKPPTNESIETIESQNTVASNPITPVSDLVRKDCRPGHHINNETVSNSSRCPKSIETIHNKSTLKLSEIKLNNTLKTCNFDDDFPNADNTFVRNKLYGSLKGNEHLTETLKKALKKPLPAGPAPQKPPRTFAHTPTKGGAQKTGAKLRGDPKYCLEKLENLLKTKGPVVKRPSLEAAERKRARDLPKLPLDAKTPSKFNLNCLGSFNCASAYEQLPEANANFFVRNGELLRTSPIEPVYAEPFEYQIQEESAKESGYDSPEGVEKSSHTIRRSVHYASSPVQEIRAESEEFTQIGTERRGLDQVCKSMESSPTSTADTPNRSSVKDLVRSIERCRHHLLDDTDTRVKNLRSDFETTMNEFDSLSINSADSSSVTSSRSLEPQEDTEADSGQNVDGLITKFETYVRRVRSVYKKKSDAKDHLFYCCLLVGLDHCTPYIKKKFPRHVQIPYKIEELCFPDAQQDFPDQSSTSQCYSLVVTSDTGERTFGYCRRVLPEGSATCLPLVYCILSKHRAAAFYRMVLLEVESRHGFPDRFLNAFLQRLYACRFPKPGDAVVIDCTRMIAEADPIDKDAAATKRRKSKYSTISSRRDCDKMEEMDIDVHSFVIVSNKGEYGTLQRGAKPGREKIFPDSPCPIQKQPLAMRRSNSSPNLIEELECVDHELIFMRPSDARHEEEDLQLLCDTLSMPILQQIFGSLLLERKVIFASSSLSKLSSCIQALQIILYPFSWPHTFIPVLPISFYEILEAPTPLICGVLTTDIINNYAIEHGMVVDLDKGAVLLKVGDEERILPNCLLTTWKHGLSLAHTFANKAGVRNVFYSDAFLRVFVQSCGHYKDYMSNGSFNNVPEFIQNCKQKGKSVRKFLKWFTETTMFNYFIDTALNDPSSLALFDQQIQLYGTQTNADILRKMKNWTSGKGFFRFDY